MHIAIQIFFFSLIIVAEISSTLLSTLKNNLGQRGIELVSDTTIESIYAKTISIFGQGYISYLSFNNPKGLLVKRSKSQDIKFVIGRYGLRAFSILYPDDTTSSWLGDPTNGWIGVMYGSEIRRLRILQDVTLPK